MKTQTSKKEIKELKGRRGASASIVIILSFIVAHLFFHLYCGSDANFDAKNNAINAFGVLYTGGFVIPIVMTLLLTVFALGVERLIALSKASGKGKIVDFVAKAKVMLDNGDIEGTAKLCDEQKGAIANILKAGLVRYEDVLKMDDLSGDQKAAIIEKEINDATSLELPYMEQNLGVIAAISNLGTLFGLFGTVLGMIRSFTAMAQEGSPDALALSLGIAEALMNTAMGIGTGASAIIVYNYFATRVENITNAVNEVAFALGQNFRS